MAATSAALAGEVAQLRREVELLRSHRTDEVHFDRVGLRKLVEVVEVVEQELGLRVQLYETERAERERVTSELRAELQDLRRAVDSTTRPPSPSPRQPNSPFQEPFVAAGGPLGAAPISNCQTWTEGRQSIKLLASREHIEAELRKPLKDLERDCMAMYSSCRGEIAALQGVVAPLREQVQDLFAATANHCQRLQRAEEALGLPIFTTSVLVALPRQAAGDAAAAAAYFGASSPGAAAEGSAEKVAPMPSASQPDTVAAPAGSQPTRATGGAARGPAAERSLAPERSPGGKQGKLGRQTRQEAQSRPTSQRCAATRAH